MVLFLSAFLSPSTGFGVRQTLCNLGVRATEEHELPIKDSESQISQDEGGPDLWGLSHTGQQSSL